MEDPLVQEILSQASNPNKKSIIYQRSVARKYKYSFEFSIREQTTDVEPSIEKQSKERVTAHEVTLSKTSKNSRTRQI